MLLRKVVDVYCKSIESKSSVDGSVTPLSPTAKLDVLQRALTSSSWAAVASTILLRARTLFAEVFGPVHASAASVTKLQGLLHAQVGEYSTACECFRQTLGICDAIGGVDVSVTAGVQYNLALCYVALCDYAAAVGCFRRLLPVYTAMYGAGHDAVSQLESKMSQALRSGMQEQYTKLYSAALKAQTDGRHIDAHIDFEKCLELVPNDPQTAYCICTCCCRVGCHDRGIAWFRLAVEWGFCDWDMANNDPELGVLHLHPEFCALVARGSEHDSSSNDDVGGADDSDVVVD